jgi:hypothetical protein
MTTEQRIMHKLLLINDYKQRLLLVSRLNSHACNNRRTSMCMSVQRLLSCQIWESTVEASSSASEYNGASAMELVS